MFTCEGCEHTDSQDDGFCYMFSDRPVSCLLNKSKAIATKAPDRCGRFDSCGNDYKDDACVPLHNAGTCFMKKESGKGSVVSSDVAALVGAAETCMGWMNEWLAENWCDCIGPHGCGKTERTAEAKQLKEAIARVRAPGKSEKAPASSSEEELIETTITVDDVHRAGMIAALKTVFSPPSQTATYFNILTLMTKLGVTEEEQRTCNQPGKLEKAPPACLDGKPCPKIRHRTTWHDIVVECERLFGCTGTAESPVSSNLPNLVRDLVNGINKKQG